MQDRFGREIRYLRLSVTELCDLRCRYCMPESGICKKRHEEMLTEEEMLLAVEAAASLGIDKLRITGGEPLVKPNILSICARSAKVEGIKELAITTNGTRLKALAKDLKHAGVQRINLSLDTLDAEKYAWITRRGRLCDALSGLEAALDAGFSKIKINAVLIGGFNEEEIPALAKLTQRYPVDVRFIEMMPMFRSEDFTQKSFLPVSRVLAYLPKPEALPESKGTAKLYRLKGALGNIGLISPLCQDFCRHCDRIRITADGKIRPCLHGEKNLEYPLKGLSREEIKAQIRQAILAKPPCHGELSPEHPSPAGRHMNQIGG